MPKLASLEAIETVADPRHRAILLAIRDTNLTLPKVADKLGIPYPTVHSIANRYLKTDYLRKRRLSCKSASTTGGQDPKIYAPDDQVYILDTIPKPAVKSQSTVNERVLSEIAEFCFDADEADSEGITCPSSDNKQTEFPNQNTGNSHLTLEFQGFRLSYEGNMALDIQSLCQIIKTVKA